MTVEVLLVDDQPLVRAGIAMLLEATNGIVVVGEAGDGSEAVALARSLRPDVVVMDLRMPGMDGVQATRRITAQDLGSEDPVRVLVLTSFRDDEAVVEAVRAGASGFLLKDTTPARLAEAVLAVARGEGWIDPAVTAELLVRVRERPAVVPKAAARLAELTAREREVLAAVASGWSNSEIAESFVVSEATVKTHVGHILAKLGLRDRAQAVAFAYQSGAVVRPPGRR